MSEEAATVEFSSEVKSLGDKIAELTLKQAKELSDYLKEEHGIEPAAGGGVMVAAAAGGGDGGGGSGGARSSTESPRLPRCAFSNAVVSAGLRDRVGPDDDLQTIV